MTREQTGFEVYVAGPFGPERPPCLPPRRRHVRAEVQQRIETWTRSALALGPAVPMKVVEWISNDPRTQAVHCVRVLVEGHRKPLRLEIASERVTEAAVGAAARHAKGTPSEASGQVLASLPNRMPMISL